MTTAKTTCSESSTNQWNPFHWLRQIYYWTLKWSNHRHNTKALAALSAAESIFFPVPTDVLLMTMCTARPSKSLNYGLLATLFSVLGGLLGYLLGFWFWEATQGFFFSYVFPEELFLKVVAKFKEHAFLSIFVASFTPIPFKVFTVAGGVASLSLWPFISAAVLGRGLRFMMVSILIYFFGEPIKTLIEKHFEKLTVLFAVLLIGGFYILKYIF